jgi:hypothetical protein
MKIEIQNKIKTSDLQKILIERRNYKEITIKSYYNSETILWRKRKDSSWESLKW